MQQENDEEEKEALPFLLRFSTDVDQLSVNDEIESEGSLDGIGVDCMVSEHTMQEKEFHLQSI